METKMVWNSVRTTASCSDHSTEYRKELEKVSRKESLTAKNLETKTD